MESDRDGKTERNGMKNCHCKSFAKPLRKQKVAGQKHVAVSDFHEQMEGLQLGAALEILKNQGKKGIIEKIPLLELHLWNRGTKNKYTERFNGRGHFAVSSLGAVLHCS